MGVSIGLPVDESSVCGGYELPASLGEFPVYDVRLDGRRVPGSDLFARRSERVCALRLIQDGLRQRRQLHALPLSPSSVVRLSGGDVGRALLRAARPVRWPDLLLFRGADRDAVETLRIGDATRGAELPDDLLRPLLEMAVGAVRCDGFPFYSAAAEGLSVGGRDGGGLLAWEDRTRVPVHVWCVYGDRAVGAALRNARRASGAFRFDPPVLYEVGWIEERPHLRADLLSADHGALVPFVYFSGGALTIGPAPETAFCGGALTDESRERY